MLNLTYENAENGGQEMDSRIILVKFTGFVYELDLMLGAKDLG